MARLNLIRVAREVENSQARQSGCRWVEVDPFLRDVWTPTCLLTTEIRNWYSVGSMTTSPVVPEVQTWPIERLVFYVRNPRKNDSAVDRMCGSIREFGFKIPFGVAPSGEQLSAGSEFSSLGTLGLAGLSGLALGERRCSDEGSQIIECRNDIVCHTNCCGIEMAHSPK